MSVLSLDNLAVLYFSLWLTCCLLGCQRLLSHLSPTTMVSNRKTVTYLLKSPPSTRVSPTFAFPSLFFPLITFLSIALSVFTFFFVCVFYFIFCFWLLFFFFFCVCTCVLVSPVFLLLVPFVLSCLLFSFCLFCSRRGFLEHLLALVSGGVCASSPDRFSLFLVRLLCLLPPLTLLPIKTR
jgi:hypothetical protein